MKKRKFSWPVAALIFILLMFLLTAYALSVFRIRVREVSEREADGRKTYGSYYTLIAEEQGDLLMESVYRGAEEEGNADGDAYVEFFGRNLAGDYTLQEQLQMAVDADVDGIILNGDPSVQTEKLVKKADREGIPVVTVLNDSAYSYRKCFVGVNKYNLGQEYGGQLWEIMERHPGDYRVAVLLDSGSADTGKNTLYLGLRETVSRVTQTEGWEHEVDIQAVSVDSSDAFGTEEIIRGLLMGNGEKPNVLICLSEADTRRAYEAVVDYNQVGEVFILGYYESPEILEAIDKEIIYSTITVDGAQMGSLCVQALAEYRETGYVNGYFPVDIHVINKENVSEYTEREAQ